MVTNREERQMTVHEVLVAARNQITEPRNWCSRGSGRPGGSRCAVAAIGDVAGVGEDGRFAAPWEETVYALLAAVGISIKPTQLPGLVFGRYNDSHTHAEVLKAFDDAIAATSPEPDLGFLADVAEEVVA